MALTIHVDGGARGNPGPAGAGVVIREDNERVYEAAFFLGRQTNNAAEYHALLRALQWVADHRPGEVTVYSDSELLVRQLTGVYQVKSPKLAPLFEQAQLLLVRVGRWTVRHVRREENTRADELANLAMDQRRDVIVFDAETGQSEDIEIGPTADDDLETTPMADAAEDAAQEMSDIEPLPDSKHAVRISVSRPAVEGACPADGVGVSGCTVTASLPAGLCLHAAHSLLPTLLAMLSTDAQEFAALPTMTVRCSRKGCGAEFQLSPVRSGNGHHGPK